MIGVIGAVGAYVAQVDHALGSGQNLFPPSLVPVGVATDLPPAQTPPPEVSATAGGVATASGEYNAQWSAVNGADIDAAATAQSGAGEAVAGHAEATGVRSTAQSQAAAIAPATGSPAGVRALVSAMDDKLSAMQRQLSTAQAQNRLLAARMRQLAGSYARMGGGVPAPGGGGFAGGGSMGSSAFGAGAPGASAMAAPASLAGALPQFSGLLPKLGAGAAAGAGVDRVPVGAGTPLGRLTASSSPREVAAAIINEAARRGYSPQQTVAILATGLQESALNPRAQHPNGLWHGIFQQDSSYPGRGNPNTNISEFFNRLATHGGPQSPTDIYKNIFWLQQSPASASAESAYAGGRQAYMAEIRSKADMAAQMYRAITA